MSDYQKGYAAGRKRALVDQEREIASRRKEAFRQQVALVALTALLRPGAAWGKTVDGQHKPYSNMEEYSAGAFQFADRMLKHTWFDGGPMEPTSAGGAPVA